MKCYAELQIGRLTSEDGSPDVMEVEIRIRDSGRVSGPLHRRIRVRIGLADFMRAMTGRGGLFGEYEEWPTK